MLLLSPARSPSFRIDPARSSLLLLASAHSVSLLFTPALSTFPGSLELAPIRSCSLTLCPAAPGRSASLQLSSLPRVSVCLCLVSRRPVSVAYQPRPRASPTRVSLLPAPQLAVSPPGNSLPRVSVTCPRPRDSPPASCLCLAACLVSRRLVSSSVSPGSAVGSGPSLTPLRLQSSVVLARHRERLPRHRPSGAEDRCTTAAAPTPELSHGRCPLPAPLCGLTPILGGRRAREPEGARPRSGSSRLDAFSGARPVGGPLQGGMRTDGAAHKASMSHDRQGDGETGTTGPGPLPFRGLQRVPGRIWSVRAADTMRARVARYACCGRVRGLKGASATGESRRIVLESRLSRV